MGVPKTDLGKFFNATVRRTFAEFNTLVRTTDISSITYVKLNICQCYNV